MELSIEAINRMVGSFGDRQLVGNE